MVKSFKQGTGPTPSAPPVPWYRRVTWHCPACGSTWQLDDDDQVVTYEGGAVPEAQMQCPANGCGAHVRIQQPANLRVSGDVDQLAAGVARELVRAVEREDQAAPRRRGSTPPGFETS